MVGFRITVSPGFVDEQEHSPRKFLIVANAKPSFTGRDVLALLHAEAADVTDETHVFASVGGVKGLGTVFDHRDVFAACQFHDRTHVARVAKQVRHDDGLRSVTQPGLDRVGGHVASAIIDIRKNGNRALIQNRCQRSHVGDRSRDELVTRLGVNRCKSSVQGG